MRKTLGAIALVLLLAAGVWVNSRLPAPHAKAREAVGERFTYKNSTPRYVSYHSKSALSQRYGTVILAASLGREASDFNELVKNLNTAGYRTIAIEAPGINGAEMVSLNSEYSTPLTRMTMPIFYGMSGAQVYEPYYVIGHAYGNRVMRNHANKASTNIKGVILLAAGGQMPMEPKAEQSLKNIFNPLRSYKSRVKDVEYAFFAEGNEVPPHWKRGWHTKTAMAQAKAVTASAGDDSWHCAGGVPMLIVQPMQDRIAPIENAYALKEKCPQEVEIVEVQNAGHALLPEQPEAVAKAVLDFLAKHHPVSPE